MILGYDIRPGFYVQLTGDPYTEGKLFHILRVGGSEYTTGDTTGTAEFSQVATTGTSNFKNIDRLEPDQGQIAWYHWHIKDGNKYQVKLKAGTIRFGPQQEPNVGFVTNNLNSIVEINDIYSFWLFKDWFPSIQATNVTPYTVTPQVTFEGFIFDMEEVKDAGLKNTILNSGKYSIISLGGVTNG